MIEHNISCGDMLVFYILLCCLKSQTIKPNHPKLSVSWGVQSNYKNSNCVVVNTLLITYHLYAMLWIHYLNDYATIVKISMDRGEIHVLKQ